MCQVSSRKASAKSVRQPSSVVRGVGEGLDGAGEEGGERGEGGLAVLVLREVVVGLQALQPDAGLDLVCLPMV
jgi:hypothetical protein